MISITFFVAFRSRFFFMGRSEMTPTFLSVVFRTDHIYIYTYFLGVAKDPLLRFRGVDPTEDDWRQS